MNNLNILVVGDTHINGTTALISPEAILNEEGGVIPLSHAQVELWNAWIDLGNSVNEPDVPLYIICMGDMVEVDYKDRSKQLFTREQNLIVENAINTLEPLLEKAERVYWLAGTEAHVGGLAEVEKMVAKNFTNSYCEGDKFVFQRLRKVIGGYRFDLAHHVNMGGVPWTEKNAANTLAAKLIFEYAEWGEELPHYAYRGHVHRVSDSGMNYPVRVITTPCWQFPTVFIHRLGQGGRKPHIGGILHKIRDGKSCEPEFIRYDVKREGWTE
jgi:hypothetical protein